MGQRKAFHRQRTPDSSCVRKKTFDIDQGVIQGNFEIGNCFSECPNFDKLIKKTFD